LAPLVSWLKYSLLAKAFSAEVAAGSAQENATNQDSKTEPLAHLAGLCLKHAPALQEIMAWA